MRSTTTPRIARLTDPPTFAGYRALVSARRSRHGRKPLNDHGPTIYLLDVKQKAKRFGGILVCARDEPEGRICMVGHRETETCISAEYSRVCFTAKVKTQLRLARRLCDCRWNRWAWEVVGFE
jgi:hypothetical protein